MILRLASIKLRIVDAVAIAAAAMLALKLIGLAAGSSAIAPSSKGAPILDSPAAPAHPFSRTIATARSRPGDLDVATTGAVTPKEEKGEAPKPAELSAKQPAPGPAAAASPSERAILERLGERRDAYQQRDRELEMREKLIENAERKLEGRINDLKTLEEKTDRAAAKRGETEGSALRNLVTMYEAMKPKDAARVFDRLSQDVLVSVVLQINPRKMAEILAVMQPESAEKLTVALASRAKGLGGDARPAVANATLPSTELPSIDPAPAKPRR
jgi:flagellar motility protein MotE (MotC chaperone)